MTLATNLGMCGLVAVMVALLGLGIVKSATRGGGDAASARRTAAAVLAVVSAWLGVTAALASTGALSVWSAVPPRLPLLPLTAFVSTILFVRTKTAKTLLASTPLHWLIAAQSFRVVVELLIFALHLDGRAPIQVTFEGRNFDMLVGLTAPLVAWLVARQRVGPKAVVAWNVLGLAVLANTVLTVATSWPGPLHREWGGEPFTAPATWPIVWLPAFLAPLAVLFHIASLRQAFSEIVRRR